MKKVALSIAMAALTLAQTPGSEKRAEFEVASVKPTATQDGSFTSNFPPGGGFSTRQPVVGCRARGAWRRGCDCRHDAATGPAPHDEQHRASGS